MITLPSSLLAPDGREIVIRRAEPDDAGALLAYLARVGGETPYLTFGAEGPGKAEAEERAFLERVRGADNAIALLATCGGEIVGCLTFEGGTRARIRHVGEFGVSVARDCWGAGVGRVLIEALIGWAAAGGVVHKIILRVRTDNVRAITLYERLGFDVEGRLTGAVFTDGVYHDVLLMGRWVE